jgi:hypothetical protein
MTTTDILALTAVILSLFSMFSTIVFSLLQQKHNRNSVRPICEIKVNDYEDKLGVYLANHGTGPLTIKEIICKDAERSSPVLVSLMPQINQPWTTFTENVTGWTIPVGERIALIELHPENESNKIHIRRALMQIEIKITYTDVYGKSKFHVSRELVFFGRTFNSIQLESNAFYLQNPIKEEKIIKK